MTGEPMLELRDVTVEFRRRQAVTRALDGVSFAVHSGETVGLVGESGSGKSTAANAILGLAAVQAGQIHFAGEDITYASFKRRREIYRDLQVVFQDPYSSLNPSLTVARTLSEPLEAYDACPRSEIRKRVEEVLERVHLPRAAADRYPSQFSGGQRQRIAIARALMLSPRLVICDEAVSALDLSVQAQIINLLRELQTSTGLSYLFISHDLEIVRYLCDRVVVLYDGRVMESGPAEQVSDSPAHPYTYALHEAAPAPNPGVQRQRRATRAAKPASDAPSRAIANGMCVFAPRCPHAIAICSSERPLLRPAAQEGLVACHRYPDWRAELPPRYENRQLRGSQTAPSRCRSGTVTQ